MITYLFKLHMEKSSERRDLRDGFELGQTSTECLPWNESWMERRKSEIAARPKVEVVVNDCRRASCERADC